MLDKKYASSCKSSIGSLPSFNPVSNVVYFRKKLKQCGYKTIKENSTIHRHRKTYRLTDRQTERKLAAVTPYSAQQNTETQVMNTIIQSINGISK